MTDTDEIERVALLPCPFCKGTNIHRAYDDETYWDVCRNCGACGPVVHKRTSNGEPDWNTRAIAAHDSGLAKQQHLDDCALSTAMLECGLATGHGDTIADMAREIPSQVMELRDKLSAAEAENARLKGIIEHTAERHEALTAENARLREALVRIAEQKVRVEFTDEEWDERNVEDGYEGCVETARAALKGGTE